MLYTDDQRAMFTNTAGDLCMSRKGVGKSNRSRHISPIAMRGVHSLTEVAAAFLVLVFFFLCRILLFVMSDYWRLLPEPEQQRYRENLCVDSVAFEDPYAVGKDRVLRRQVAAANFDGASCRLPGLFAELIYGRHGTSVQVARGQQVLRAW